MMHKRNLAITAAVLAGIVTVIFFAFEAPNHSKIVGYVYFPAILLSVIISPGHSPSAFAGWSSFIVYTLFYWVVFLIIYVLLLEFYLLRQVLHHLDDAQTHLTAEQPDATKGLDHIGRAIAELETRRRKHFLLQPINTLDLTQPPHLLAAQAISRSDKSKPVKKLMKKMEAKIRATKTPEHTATIMTNLHQEATRLANL